jgi:ABC-2 type transport system ATP-binding protein
VEIAVKTQNLTKYYGSVRALNNLTIEVKRGVFGLLGPNAAGKTTTINILLGLVKPTSGEAYVLGIDAVKRSMEVRRRVGYLPEDPVFYEEMSGWDHLNFIAKLRGMPSGIRRGQVTSLLEWAGLSDAAKKKVGKYSQGMKQRLAIAQSLVGDPELVLLDEPTSNLDPLGREDVLKLIKRLRREGKAVFVSSHVLSEVERVCDEVAVMDRGDLILKGSLTDVKLRFSSGRFKMETSNNETVLKRLLKQGYVKDAWIEGESIMVVPEDEGAFKRNVLQLVAKSRCDIIRLEREVPSLREAFISLIERHRRGKK